MVDHHLLPFEKVYYLSYHKFTLFLAKI